MFSVVIIITCVLKSNGKLIELNGLSTIINNRSDYGFDTLIDHNETKRLLWQSYIMISGAFTTVITFSLLTFYQQINLKLTLMTLRMIVLPVAYLNQMMMFDQYITSIFLYKHLFIKCFDQLENVLNIQLNKSELIKSSTIVRESEENSKVFSLETSLVKLKMFYMSIIENYRQLNSFMQPMLLLGFLVSSTILVFDCYTVVQIYANVVEVDPLSQTRSFIAILTFPIFFVMNDYVYSVVSTFILCFSCKDCLFTLL